jgi:hypothetical protein
MEPCVMKTLLSLEMTKMTKKGEKQTKALTAVVPPVLLHHILPNFQ